MALLLPPGKRFLDGNGDPVSAGYLYVYQNNTTTLANIFSDAGLSAALANPIQLDGSGLLPTNVYTAPGSFTLRLSDSGDAELWTRNDSFGWDAPEVVETEPLQISSVAELRLIDSTEQTVAFLTGRDANLDGGGGHYVVDPTDTTSVDDGSAVIVGDDGARWKLFVVTTDDEPQLTLRGFGASGNGSTVDDSAITAAMNSAQYLIDGEGLTYRINSGLTRTLVDGDLNSGIRKKFINCVFDSSGATAGEIAMTLSGKLDVSSEAPASVLAAGGSQVGVADSSQYSVGQWLLFQSADSFDDGSVTNGEFNQVRALTSASLLTMQREFYLGYNSSRLAYSPALFKEVTFENCTFLGGGDARDRIALKVELVETLNIINCRFHDCANRGFEALNCVNVIVDGMIAENGEESSGLSYGMAIYRAAESVRVSNCIGRNLRHLATFGTSSAGAGITCNVGVSNCHGSAMTDSGLDTHVGCYSAHFSDSSFDFANSIADTGTDGITMQGAHSRCTNVTVNGPGNHGILMQPLSSVDDDTMIVEGCVVLNHGKDTSSSRGVLVSIQKPAGDVELVRVAGSIRSSQASTLGVGLANTGSQGTLKLMQIDALVDVTNRCIQISPSEDITVERIDVRGSFRQAGTSTECLYFTCNTASDVEKVNINAESIIGGNYGVRNVSDNVGTIRARVVEISGQATGDTLGTVSLDKVA